MENNYLNNDKIATVIINPTPSPTENYLWVPEVSDNAAPGLDSLVTYTQPKYATLAALRNSITNIHNTINNEIQNIQTEMNNIEITNPTPGNVSKHLHIIQVILILCTKEILVITITEEILLHNSIISHINERVIMRYRFQH